jgi:hypothetical protein
MALCIRDVTFELFGWNLLHEQLVQLLVRTTGGFDLKDVQVDSAKDREATEDKRNLEIIGHHLPR